MFLVCPAHVQGFESSDSVGAKRDCVTFSTAHDTIHIVINFSCASIYVQLQRQCEKRLNNGAQRLHDYSEQFEKLLSLLTQALRTIQEMEIISRGYSRFLIMYYLYYIVQYQLYCYRFSSSLPLVSLTSLH